MSDRGVVVGFDLDMTLIDSRPGILDTLAALANECDGRGDCDLGDSGDGGGGGDRGLGDGGGDRGLGDGGDGGDRGLGDSGDGGDGDRSLAGSGDGGGEDGHEGVGATLRDPGLLDALLRRNLDLEFADRLPADRAQPLADRFRELYVEHGVPGSFLLPGAIDAIGAIRSGGGRAIVVTAKYEPNAWRCLRHVGIEVDAVYGWRLGPAKAGALTAEGATVYVGDTPRDVEAARLAGATAVAVATGPHPADELRDAGSDVVLSSLVGFPAWWAAHRGRC